VGTINRDGLLEQFKAHLSESGLAPATVVNYLADLRAFFRWCEESDDAVSSPFCLDSSGIQAFCMYLRDTKEQAPATVNRRLQALRKFYSLAVTEGWTATNPAEDASLLSESTSERSRSLTPEDVARLLDTVRRSRPRWAARDRAIFQVLLGAGLKLGELTELRTSDVRLDTGEPHLHARSSADDPGRTIPVDAEVCDALDSYLPKRQAADGVDHFFVNRDGNPLSTRSVQRLLRYYAEAAELDGLTTQALRFVYAQKLYESCGDLKLVAEYLGHRHLATTIRYLRPSSPPE
jgi:site-specific recombinase XerD